MEFKVDKEHSQVVAIIRQVLPPGARWNYTLQGWSVWHDDMSEPTPAEKEQLRVLLYDMPVGWALVGTTDADIDTWIAGVTDLATARQRMAVLAKLLVYLMRRSLK